MGQYLYCFDGSDKLKCLNFCSRQVIESLFALQLIVVTDKKPNPRNIEIENLKNCRLKDIEGLSSPRMSLIYQASLNKQLPEEKRSEKESIAIKKADFELFNVTDSWVRPPLADQTTAIIPTPFPVLQPFDSVFIQRNYIYNLCVV